MVTSACGSSTREPIRIGVITDCEGGFGSSEVAFAGAELPLLTRGAKLRGSNPSDGVKDATIAGKPVELLVACERFGSRASALAEMRTLVEQKGADIVVGPTFPTASLVVRDYAKRRPGTTFVYSSFDQSTTLDDPAPNVFRFRVTMAQWGAGLGAYAYRDLHWRHAVTIGEDGVGWDGVAGFIAEFCSLGGGIARRLWVPGGITNFAPVVARIPKSADGVFLPTSLYATKGLVSAWSARHHDLGRWLVAGDVVLSQNPGDRRLLGVVAANPTPWVPTHAWSRYAADLAHAFPGIRAAPIDALDSYDGVEPVVEALEKVDGDVSHGEQRLMAALARLKFESPEGPRPLDARHQAIGVSYLGKMVEGKQGRLRVRQIRVFRGVDQTFGGHLSPSVPAASRTQPRCVHGNPPSWAR
jgi:branched-chain amino acid transport system substrate-binding protein